MKYTDAYPLCCKRVRVLCLHGLTVWILLTSWTYVIIRADSIALTFKKLYVGWQMRASRC
jgi:hypothetical protein